MIKNNIKDRLAYAKELDEQDELRAYRNQFYIPKQKNGAPHIYLCGNSLGLQPKITNDYIQQELKDWQNYGVDGHEKAKTPWLPYHEYLTDRMAKIVGAKPIEVVVMNTLSVNLHLLMASFYRPTKKRYKILIESDAFPSDRYAVESQVKFHGYKNGVLELSPRKGEDLLRAEDIETMIEKHGDEIALILIGCPNYYTGQVFNLKRIAALGHAKGCMVGIDLAHGAGNIKLELHDAQVDFAAWCTYKYLNSGPGSVGGCFIHERHSKAFDIPRFAGWWGHNKETRFGMRDPFNPIAGAEGWQLSNPPILSLAAINASLSIFEDVGMEALIKKSKKLTGYLEELVTKLGQDVIEIVTPKNTEERGCQLSLRIKSKDGKSVFDAITRQGVVADWRSPDVIRVAPTPLYNTFEDVYHFAQILKKEIEN